MFNFRLINMSDGSQVIDTTLKTPYDSITPLQMLDYIEVDEKISNMERLEKKNITSKKRHNILSKLVYFCGIMLHIIFN